MPIYRYRRGNGNEGNFPKAIIELKPSDNAYAALEALVANDYLVGRSMRRYVMRNIETDGEEEFGIHAMVYEGPEGESAFGAAWITAELQPVDPSDLDGETVHQLRDYLDRAALTYYRKRSKR